MDTPLTPREKETLQHLFTGKSNREIASLMGVTEYAIRKRLRVSYLKLGVHSTRELFPLVIAGQRELATERAAQCLIDEGMDHAGAYAATILKLIPEATA